MIAISSNYGKYAFLCQSNKQFTIHFVLFNNEKTYD